MLEHHTVIDETQSLCPTCLRVVNALIVERDGAVEQVKECPEHGETRVHVWPDADHYRWMDAFRLPLVASPVQVPVKDGCPHDCGLCTAHQRRPTLAEIEVTQRCNLRCPVCFVAAAQAPPDPPLSTIEEMYRSIAENSGLQTSVQLTGGEPTVRRELPEIIRMGRRMGFDAIEINTNGVMLARDPAYAAELVNAGLTGVYLQFDGPSDEAYEQIRGRALLDEKLRAIQHCRAAGVQVVLAMTVVSSVNHHLMGEVLELALANTDVVAGLAYQPAFTSGRFDVAPPKRLTAGDVIFMLAEQSGGLIEPYDLWPLGTSHPLCSAATYLVEAEDGRYPLTRYLTPQQYAEMFDPDSPQGSVFPDIAAQLMPGAPPGLSVVVMNYMDATSMDMKRLKECSMVVTMENGLLLPFCAYQTSDLDGRRLYPTWGRCTSGHPTGLPVMAESG